MRSARSPLLTLLLLLLLGVDIAHFFLPFDLTAKYLRWCGPARNSSKRCKKPEERFYHNVTSRTCEPFRFYGCPWNENIYPTLKECQKTCMLAGKPGGCPKDFPPMIIICPKMCQDDWDCPGGQKCCHYGCRTDCKDPV